MPPGGQSQGGLRAGRFPRGRPDQLSRTDPRWRLRGLGGLFGRARDGCWDLLSPGLSFYFLLGEFPMFFIFVAPVCKSKDIHETLFGLVDQKRMELARHLRVFEPELVACQKQMARHEKMSAELEQKKKELVSYCPSQEISKIQRDLREGNLSLQKEKALVSPPSQVAAPRKDGGRPLPGNRQPPHPSELFAGEGLPGEN